MDGVAPLRHRDDPRDRNRIEGEIGRRCRGHQEGPAKSDTCGDFAMKDQFCGANRESEVCQIKKPLNRAGTRIGVPERLDKSPQTAHQHSFRIGEVKDANQNKEEIRRHRGFDAWQVHLKDGGAHGDSQKADISERVIRVPADKGVNQYRQPSDELSEDKGEGRNPEGLDVTPGVAPVALRSNCYHTHSYSLPSDSCRALLCWRSAQAFTNRETNTGRSLESVRVSPSTPRKALNAVLN